jgi:hypothetical protein
MTSHRLAETFSVFFVISESKYVYLIHVSCEIKKSAICKIMSIWKLTLLVFFFWPLLGQCFGLVIISPECIQKLLFVQLIAIYVWYSCMGSGGALVVLDWLMYILTCDLLHTFNSLANWVVHLCEPVNMSGHICECCATNEGIFCLFNF